MNLIQQLLNNKKSANHADIQELVKFYEEVSPPNNPSKNFSKTISKVKVREVFLRWPQTIPEATS